MKVILSLVSILLISSCTHPKGVDFTRRNIEEYFVSSGVVKYLLPELPGWANFSHSGQCRRNTSTKFLHYKNLRSSFSLNYEGASHFQHLFNIESRKASKAVEKAKYLPFKEEENIFYSVSEKIQAGLKIFVKPKFKRVNLVWIDFALGDKAGIKRLKRLMESTEMAKGHPVFVSLCLNQDEFDNFLVENKLDAQNIRLIPFELFSPYDEQSYLANSFSLQFDRLFNNDQSLHFFLPGKTLPPEFIGNFKIHSL